MTHHPTVVLCAPFTDSLVVTDPPSNPALGEIFIHANRPAIKCVVPTAEVVTHRDYVAELHHVSEFPEPEAPISRNDEPLFTRGRWKRVVEHMTFGRGTALYRKQLNGGTFALVVKYGDGERTLVIDAAHWITPIETLLHVKMQKVKKFTVPAGWPKPTDPTEKNPFPRWKLDRFAKYFRSTFTVRSTSHWTNKHEQPACECRNPQPKFVDPVIVHSEGERQAQTALPRPRVSAAECARYEAKLFADVATYRAKDQSRTEAAPALTKYAKLYWEFCVNFEFPKVYDEEAMGKAAEQLMESVPNEYLESLVRSAAHRGLLEGSFQQQESGFDGGAKRTRSRHYVLGKRGNDLSFVRQQDVNLATEEVQEMNTW